MSEFDDRIAMVVRIEGRVQGVSYRAWAESEAAARSLDGWVRNRRDGSVEALFAGPRDSVEDMITACSSGPPAARVSAVHRSPGEPPGHRGFRTLPTL